MNSDTDEKSRAVWLRLQRALEMTALVRSMFVANLRREEPGISEAEIKRRMVECYYGVERAERMYGPRGGE